MLRRGIDVGHDRNARIARRQRAQLRREAILRGLHERAVERRADGERHDALCAQLFRARARAIDGSLRAGNHDLAGAVHVRRRHHLAVRRLGARLRDAIGIETENGRHRARADRHGLLHVAATPTHRAHRVGK